MERGQEAPRLLRITARASHAGLVLRKASGTCELFAKPDDRWEVNEVAARCPREVELMTAALLNSPAPPAPATARGSRRSRRARPPVGRNVNPFCTLERRIKHGFCPRRADP